MPALIFLGRKWLVACDDFVIPFVIESLLRIYWFFTISTFIWLKLDNCIESIYNSYFIYAASVNLLLTSLLSFSIAFVSARGSVLEVGKRKCIPKLLLIKLVTLFCDIIITSFGTWLFINAEGTCKMKEIFIKITTVLGWIYCLVAMISVTVCYDTLGSFKYWHVKNSSTSVNLLKRMQYMWQLRLKCFCCCADISEGNDFIYVEISTFLTSFLNGIDLAPSDILTGIITLSQKHVLERRKFMLRHMPKALELLEKTPVPDWMTTRNVLHFLRIAKSTYGWVAFLKIFQPWNLCLLSTHAKCNICCFENNDTQNDNCCYLNSAAVQKISGISEPDILYASFRNCIHEPAFYVALDHSNKYVIIAIRGTRSFSDILTDMDAENLPFPSEEETRFKCHRGVLRSATFLEKQITELKILEMAFEENPSYTLALTGHSLGGSIAAMLAVILHPKYPDLQCYSYGPMAIISASGIPETLRYVLTVVVGEDVAPRLCAMSCRKLKKQLMQSLSETKEPKFQILAQACWYHIKKYFSCYHHTPLSDGQENVLFSSDEESATDSRCSAKDSTLYAPGRILYFERRKWENPYWLTGLNLQNIIMNPNMITDHQPHKIQYCLDTYAESLQDKPKVVIS